MPKPEANTAEKPSLSVAMANADAASAADAQSVANDLVAAVADGVKDAAAPARKLFTAHSQAAAERLLTEERALVETLNDLDAKIFELNDQREDAFRAYTAVQVARESLGGGK